jgi:amino acid permease
MSLGSERCVSEWHYRFFQLCQDSAEAWRSRISQRKNCLAVRKGEERRHAPQPLKKGYGSIGRVRLRCRRNDRDFELTDFGAAVSGASGHMPVGERELADHEAGMGRFFAWLGRFRYASGHANRTALENDFVGAADKHCGWTTWFYVYFMSIATVLGTGVLGLPVSLHRCGIAPFLVFFTVTLAAETCAVVVAVELLQRTQAHMRHAQNRWNIARTEATDFEERVRRLSRGFADDQYVGTDPIVAKTGDGHSFFGPYAAAEEASSSRGSSKDLTDMNMARLGGEALIAPPVPRAANTQHPPEPFLSDLGNGNGEESVSAREAETPAASSAPAIEQRHEAPSLPVMARHFFEQRWLRLLFEFAVYLHFVSIMISYGLAGPQAYASLFRPSLGMVSKQTLAEALIAPKWSIAIFCIGGAALLVFLLSAVLPVLTIATGLKATLLVVIVLVVGILGAEIANPWHNQWSAFVEPFLMGTVALGGLTTVMPVTYARLGGTPSARGVRRYRAAVIAGLVTCYGLNIVWCVSVLAVVPQRAQDWSHQIGNVTAPSLEMANTLGEISTVPLIAALEQYNAGAAPIVAVLVNIFITVSITVSYLVIGSGLRHMIDGVATAWSSARNHHLRFAAHRNASAPEEALNGTGNQTVSVPPEQSEEDAAPYERASKWMVDGVHERRRSPVASDENLGLEKRASEATYPDTDGMDVLSADHTDGDSVQVIVDHGLDDVAADVSDTRNQERAHGRLGANKATALRYALYATFYGFITLVAVMNPRGFLAVMEGFASLGLNLACGLFLALMLYLARNDPPAGVPEPLGVHHLYWICYFCFVFFGLAATLDAAWWLPRRLIAAVH